MVSGIDLLGFWPIAVGVAASRAHPPGTGIHQMHVASRGVVDAARADAQSRFWFDVEAAVVVELEAACGRLAAETAKTKDPQ